MIVKIKAVFTILSQPAWSLLLAAGFIFLLALVSPNSYTGSDAHFSLLVSQAIIEHGTLQLDAYLPEVQEQLSQFAYQLQPNNEHTYYAFPIGTSVLMLPFVGLVNLFGFDMAQTADNYLLQNLLSAAICAALFLALYQLCTCYINHTQALLITLITMLGSTLISTLATALWSLDLTVLCLTLALLLMCRHATDKTKPPNPYLLGFLLFAAFFCRPTSAIFILIAFGYLWRHARPTLWPTATTAAILLALFLLANFIELGVLIPPYYLPQRLGEGQADLPVFSLFQRLNGLLLSPSRGFFSFTPWAIVVLVGCVIFGRKLAHQHPWFRLSIIWWVAQLAVVSQFPHWWGGYSFGPRLLTDSLPAVVLLTALLAATVQTTPGRKWWVASFALTGLFSIWIHSGQGLFNVNTTMWNVTPSIDEDPDILFDWHTPQFFATAANNTDRWLEYTQSAYTAGTLDPPVYNWGTPLTHDSVEAIYIGWWSPHPNEWWSDTTENHILFEIGDVENMLYTLQLHSQALETYTVNVRLNGHFVDTLTISANPATYPLTAESSWLRPNSLNTLTLEVPSATFPLRQIPEVGIRAARHRIALKNTWLTLQVIE
ncbi:MAG: hypothetical protein ACI9EW_000995 [Cellvibrionaceae bacterium]|jgi:hypothetical protein